MAHLARQFFDLLASLLWLFGWASVAAVLFITSMAIAPFLLIACACGRLSKKR